MSDRRKEGEGRTGPMVVLRNVNRTFMMGSREVHALREVSMTLPVGTMATIQGPSGSGKTTLLNVIGAMDVPTSGSVKVADQELGRLTDDALTSFRKHHVGFVFQFFNLIPSLNAVENVLVPAMFDGDPPLDRALALLERVGLADRWDHLPAQLSGGERQRLAVARALINDPPLVLADEPTGNLDHETGEGVLRLFSDLVEEGRTVILVTHDDEVAERGEIVYLLRDGVMSERKEAQR
ncbi:MAG: ABC transporter ATP-binding protein [Thermoplasmata archaeon]|nr:MAG: ABC transporter ATP-binding protein [Thermoplasmata archaeon]UCC93788.1 MAG: ABC transporter ATP-binding protein [Thermoplasmata archaeon]